MKAELNSTAVLACCWVLVLVLVAQRATCQDSYGDGAALEMDVTGMKPPKKMPKVPDKLLELLDVRQNDTGEWLLPRLLYEHDALEPFMDERTVRIHHTGHHAAYTSRMNGALSYFTTSMDDAQSKRNPLEHLQHLHEVPEDWQLVMANQGGGYVNHAFSFFVMGPVGEEVEREPTGKLLEIIEESFGTVERFRELFLGTATSVFGSGYTWLCLSPKSDDLLIVKTQNQDSPLSNGLRPLLVIDLWEHAYYLRYQNVRNAYMADWWLLVDWDRVQQLYWAWQAPLSRTTGQTASVKLPDNREEL